MNSGALGQPVYGLTRAYGANSELKIPAVFQYDEQGYAVDLKPGSIPMSRYLNMNFIYDDDAGSDPYVKSCRTNPGNEDAVLDESFDKVKERKRARAVTLMMAIAMARGNLTVRPELAERAKDLLNYKVYPVIPRMFHADTASQADLIPVNAWLLGAIGYTQDAEQPADPLPMPYFQAKTLYQHPSRPQAPVGACFWDEKGNVGTTKQVMAPHFGKRLQLPFYGDDSLGMSQNAYALGSMLLMYEENKSIIESAISHWDSALQPAGAALELRFDGDIRDGSEKKNPVSKVGATLTDGRHGFGKTAYKFDGLNASVQGSLIDSETIKNGLIAGNGREITLSAWFKAENTRSDVGSLIGISRDLPDGISGRGIALTQDGKLRAGDSVEQICADRNVGHIVSSKSYNDGEWHHVAFVEDKSGGRLYVDGSREGRSVSSPCSTLGRSKATDTQVDDNMGRGLAQDEGENTALTFQIGQRFKGSIDDVRVYNRAIIEDEIKALAEPASEAIVAYKYFLKDFKMALNTSATNPIIVRKFMKANGPDSHQEVQKRAVLGSGFFDITFIAHSFKVMAGFVADATIQTEIEAGNYEKNAQVMAYVRSANQAKTISGYKDDYSPQTANLLWNFEDMLPFVKQTFNSSPASSPKLQPYADEQLDIILDTSYAMVVNQEAIIGADSKPGALTDLIGSAKSVMLEGRREVLYEAYRARQRLPKEEYKTIEDVADLNSVLQNLALLADYTFRVRRAYNKIAPSGPLFFAINTLNYGIDDGPNRGAYYHITKIRSLADVSGLVPLSSQSGESSVASMARILENRIHRVLQSYEVMLGVEAYTVRTAVEYLAKYSDMDFFDVAAKLSVDTTLLPYQVREQGIPFRKYDAMKNSIGMDLVSTIEGIAKGVYAKPGIKVPARVTPSSIETLMGQSCAGLGCAAYKDLVKKVSDCCATEDSRVQFTLRLNDLKFALALQQETSQQKTRSLEYMTPTRLSVLYKSLYRKPYVATGWKDADNSAERALQDVTQQLAIAASEDELITEGMVSAAVNEAINSVEALIGGEDKPYPLYHLLGLSFNGRNANTWAFDTLWRFQDPSLYNADTGEDTRQYPFNLMPTHLPVTGESYLAAKQLTASTWGKKKGNKKTSFTNVFLDDASAAGMPKNPELFKTLLTIDPEERGLQDNMSYRTIPAQLGQIVQAIRAVSGEGKRATVHFWDLNGLLVDFSRQTWKRWSYAFHEAHLPGAFDHEIFQPWALERLASDAVDGTKAQGQWYSAGQQNGAAKQDTYYAALATVKIVKQLKNLLSMEAIASARMVEFRRESLAGYSQFEIDGSVKALSKKADKCGGGGITLTKIEACAERIFN